MKYIEIYWWHNLGEFNYFVQKSLIEKLEAKFKTSVLAFVESGMLIRKNNRVL